MNFLGALALASVLLYPKTLGGAAVFSGWVPFNSSILDRVTPDAKKVSLSVGITYLLAFTISCYMPYTSLFALLCILSKL